MQTFQDVDIIASGYGTESLDLNNLIKQMLQQSPSVSIVVSRNLGLQIINTKTWEIRTLALNSRICTQIITLSNKKNFAVVFHDDIKYHFYI